MSWTPIDQENGRTPGTLPSPFLDVLTTGDEGSLPRSIHDFIHGTRDGDLLRIMSPVIDDKESVEDIIAARKRGVVVRVLTTLADRHGIHTKGWDASQDIGRHDESIRQLAREGVILRSPPSTPHGKFLVRNASCCLFGSANLAKGSLRGTALEAGLMLEDAGLSASLAETFDTIWRASPFSMRHRKGAVILEEGGNNELAVASGTGEITEFATRVLASGPGCPDGKDRLVKSLRCAQHEVILVAMSLYETNQIPDLHAAILEALRCGVRIRAIVRLEHFRVEEEKGRYPDSSTVELIRAGMELYGVSGLHAKGLVVDDSWVAIQSSNFNPYSLDASREVCNVEIMVCDTCKSAPFSAYALWMRALADSARYQWVECPSAI